MTKIIDGKAHAAAIKTEVTKEAAEFYMNTGVIPQLAVIVVGNNPASTVYVRNKQKACEDVGFETKTYPFDESISEGELLKVIESLNCKSDIHGILVQLPLPSHINEKTILEAVSPAKDVDAFHPYNVGRIVQGNADFLPCTPAGIMEMLKRENIEIEGKECVVIGRSNIVGKPMAQLLVQANGTVTVCHSRTKNLTEVCKRADILVCAVGKPKFVTSDFVKPGAVVIDVGINRDENGKLCGDVDFEAVKDIADYITPVPGGCGPMTIAMLLKNTLKAAKLWAYREK
jgi:methylenetetrahydrofolate dehydrogenase (NADP+)/methenyltetrahydrofolate cyclohydrolase